MKRILLMILKTDYIEHYLYLLHYGWFTSILISISKECLSYQIAKTCSFFFYNINVYKRYFDANELIKNIYLNIRRFKVTITSQISVIGIVSKQLVTQQYRQKSILSTELPDLIGSSITFSGRTHICLFGNE